MLARFLSALCRRFGPVSRARTPETKATSTPAAETTPAPAALTLPVAPRVDAVPCLARDGSVHRMVYYEWGEADNPEVVVCVHGLTRTGRDFDVLAHRLARRFRVVCPDIVGRGLSDWLGPKSDYGIPQYLSDITTLLGKLRPRRLLWVGTSMGGILGMALAAQPGSLIDRLVLNDVGGEIAAAALQRIGSYVGAAHRFASLTQAEAHVRKIHAGFGPLTDAQWRHLTWHSVRQEVDGRWVLRYDPAIAVAMVRCDPLPHLGVARRGIGPTHCRDGRSDAHAWAARRVGDVPGCWPRPGVDERGTDRRDRGVFVLYVAIPFSNATRFANALLFQTCANMRMFFFLPRFQ